MFNTTISHLVHISYESDEPLCDYDKSCVASALQLALDDRLDALAPINLSIQAYSVDVKPQDQPLQPPSSPSAVATTDSKWQAMPLSATRKMIDAAERVEEDGFDAMYQAMRAAAPKPANPESLMFVSQEAFADVEQVGMHAPRTANGIQNTPLFKGETDTDAANNDHGESWGEDGQYPLSDWMYEVQNGDTRAGYWQWVESKKNRAMPEHSFKRTINL
ncbi:hypothetical protein QAO71_16995 (plasmid) [Halopseudomonas sp. SMJS2]|uniref:hypothetical protein n=1 Tax=Halopseudomonas sp. SMJS2 TaxID=3041098 RepID=UPI002453288B|nr:hypothetical protein [Halopseudomonas sp. SMJS2]WGK63468.1 hypothetical protein QAO71_16995 [Halopseudomonas sp. SMJS2]